MSKKDKQKFNYCVGHYWEDGCTIDAYSCMGEVTYGTLKDAKKFLKYVKDKDPNEDYKIFMVVEIPT